MLTFTTGCQELEGREYQGVWTGTTKYVKHAMVTFHNSLWIARSDSIAIRPGTNAAWQLSCRAAGMPARGRIGPPATARPRRRTMFDDEDVLVPLLSAESTDEDREKVIADQAERRIAEFCLMLEDDPELSDDEREHALLRSTDPPPVCWICARPFPSTWCLTQPTVLPTATRCCSTARAPSGPTRRPSVGISAPDWARLTTRIVVWRGARGAAASGSAAARVATTRGGR
jgi:hypothetical protein